MIGQKKLLSRIDSYTLSTLPKSILFLGEEGCGKHMIANHIAEIFRFKKVIVDKETDTDTFADYQLAVVPTLLIIDLRLFAEKDQNKFLKFIEEPAKNIWVVLLANSEIGILPTVLNRCTKFHFDQYSVNELKQFQWLDQSENDLVYKICRTPGQIEKFGTAESSDRLVEAYNYCKLLVDDFDKLSYTYLISSAIEHVNCKEDYNKITFDLFILVLEYVLFEAVLKNEKVYSQKMYKVLNDYRQYLVRQHARANNYLEYDLINVLTKMYYEVHTWTYSN